MIILSTTQALEIVLSGAVTTNQLDFVAHYSDYNDTGDTFAPATNTGTTNGAVAVDMVASPAAGQRMVKAWTVRNNDTVDATVTVRLDDNGTDRDILTVTLATGEHVQYADGRIAVLDASGALKTVLNYVHTHTSDAQGGQLDHGGALTGLGDDDHTQYLLASGARAGASAGAQDFGSNGITADGIVESTTDAGVTIEAVLLNDGEVDVTGDLTSQAGRVVNVTAVGAATYDLLTSDDILSVTYTGTGAVTSLTLPTAQVVAGRRIVVKDAGGNATTNNITIDTEGAQTIDGAATYVINTDYGSISLYCDGTNWFTY